MPSELDQLVTYLVTDPRSGTSIKVEAPVNASKEELVRLANRQYRIQELERISARHSDTVPSELDQLREEAKEKYEAMAKERRDLMERLSKGSKRRKLGAFARAAGQYGAANPLGGIGGIMSAGGVGMDNERLRQGKEESTMLATLHDLQKAGITSGLEYKSERNRRRQLLNAACLILAERRQSEYKSDKGPFSTKFNLRQWITDNSSDLGPFQSVKESYPWQESL